MEREIDLEDLAEAIRERRRNSNRCKCGYPDWPGQCPGPAFCTVHGENEETEE